MVGTWAGQGDREQRGTSGPGLIVAGGGAPCRASRPTQTEPSVVENKSRWESTIILTTRGSAITALTFGKRAGRPVLEAAG